MLCSFYSIAQVNAEYKEEKKGRWVIGGGLGIGFNRGFNLQLSPDIGYRINNFEFGLTPGILYQKYNGTDEFYDPDYKSTLWNVGPYLFYMPVENFFLRTQYQYYEGKFDIDSQYYLDDSYSENTLWIGGGYQDRIANHVYMRLGIMYNVLYDEDDSIFSTGLMPIFGISVGL